MTTKEIIGYCVRCHHKREMRDVELTQTKRGVPLAKGFCLICGGRMCRIGNIE